MSEPAPTQSAPPAPSRLDRVRLRMKQAGWALAISVFSLFCWSFAGEAVGEGLTALVPHLVSSPEGRAALATLLSGLAASTLAALAALLAGLVVDLPLAAGALGGLGALLLPVALPWMFEGPDDSPGVLVAARVAALVAGAAAGALGLLASRRLLARARSGRSSG